MDSIRFERDTQLILNKNIKKTYSIATGILDFGTKSKMEGGSTGIIVDVFSYY